MSTTPTDPGPAPDDGDAPALVVETTPGVYDARFALVTGIVALVAITGEILGTVLLVRAVGLPESAVVVALGEDAVIYGSFAERVGASLAIALAGAGVALLTIAAWLAGLEARGRLTATVSASSSRAAEGLLAAVESPAAGAVSALGAAVAAVAGRVVNARGTALVALSGILLVAGATTIGTATVLGGGPPAGTEQGAPAGDG